MDPINPIAGNPEALNTNPQIPEAPKDSHGITIAALAIFILLALGAVIFLYYQNQQLKSMLASYQTVPSSTPVATSDPRANWKTFTNTQLNFEIKYPPDWTNIGTQSGTLSTGSIGFQGSQGTLNLAWGSGFGNNCPTGTTPYTNNISNLNGCTLKNPDGTLNWNIFKTIDSQDSLVIKAHAKSTNMSDSDTIDQILSTFKFTGSTSSPSTSPTACTQEARLCPNGTYVSRTGPNCEFAPCPTP